MQSGPLLVILAAALWGTTGTAQALGPDGITAATVSLIRMAGGSLLWLYVWVRKVPIVWPALLRPASIAAVAAMAASQPMFFAGVDRAGVAVGTIVTIGSGPVLAGGLAFLVRGERVDRRWSIATVLAVLGAVLLLSGGEAAGVDPIGVMFALGAGVAWAIYLVSAKELLENVAPATFAAFAFTGAAVLLLPVLFFQGLDWVATERGLLVVLWLGIAATAVSYIFFASGLKATPVATAATLTLAEPLTAGLLGIVILDERLGLVAGTGAVLLMMGLLIVSSPLGRIRSPRSAKAGS
jgi:DME family drug/metabolite transporter